MGVSSSSINIDDIVDVLTSIAFQTQNDCATNVSNISEQRYEVGDRGTIDVSGTVTQSVSYNFVCYVSNESQNNIDTNLEEAIKQVAKSTIDGLALGDVSLVNEYTKLLTNVSTDIKYEVMNTCRSNVLNKAKTTATGGNDATIIANIDVNQSIEGMQSCVLKNISNNKSYTELKKFVDQRAESSVTGLLGGSTTIIIVIIIVIIIIIILVVLYRSFSKK